MEGEREGWLREKVELGTGRGGGRESWLREKIELGTEGEEGEKAG